MAGLIGAGVRGTPKDAFTFLLANNVPILFLLGIVVKPALEQAASQFVSELA
jgi:hypothetical protein